MKTLVITHNIYDDVATISKEAREVIYDYANSEGLEIIGNMSIAHGIVYNHIADALLEGHHVKLVANREEYYYIKGDHVQNKWEVFEAWRNNLIENFKDVCGSEKIWQGKDLEVLNRHSRLLRDDVYYEFSGADARRGDIVIYNGKRYEAVCFGVLKYFEVEHEVHSLVEKSLLPKGTRSTVDEIKDVFFNKARYTCEIIKSKTIVE